MGNGMNKIISGVYVGNIRDAKDLEQLKNNSITHVLSIHDYAQRLHADRSSLVISAKDNQSQDLLQYVSRCNDFIHMARVNGGNVLVHCVAGCSRSVTIVTAYIMSVTGLGWRDALNSVKGARRCANPNFGFQRQLLAFEHDHVSKERQRLRDRYPQLLPYQEEDEDACITNMAAHYSWVMHGDKGLEKADLLEGHMSNGAADLDMYALPHNAYGDRVRAKLKEQQQEKSKMTQNLCPDTANKEFGESMSASSEPSMSTKSTGSSDCTVVKSKQLSKQSESTSHSIAEVDLSGQSGFMSQNHTKDTSEDFTSHTNISSTSSDQSEVSSHKNDSLSPSKQSDLLPHTPSTDVECIGLSKEVEALFK